MKLIDAIKGLRGMFVRPGKKTLLLKYTYPGRFAMLDGEEYYLGFRACSGKLVRLTRKKSSFWDILDVKRYLNCGKRTPLYFILDHKNRIVSTIDRKFATIAV